VTLVTPSFEILYKGAIFPII